MNRVVALVSLLIAVLSGYGQQNVQSYDVSNFAPNVKQCLISITDDKLYVYIDTGEKDVTFWVGEPQRTGALMVLGDNDMMELRQAFFAEFIDQSLKNLPANAIVKSHVQQEPKDYDIDPMENPGYEFYPNEKEQSDEGYSDEETYDYSENQYADRQMGDRVGNTDNVASGVMQQSNSGLSQQQGGQDTRQSEGNGSGLDGILENILMLVIGYWLLKAVLKGFFGSSKSSSKKSSSDKDYEDGPAWFHDHNQSI